MSRKTVLDRKPELRYQRRVKRSDLLKPRKGRCRWCNEDVDSKYEFHSECYAEFLFYSKPKVARTEVWQRDKGKCKVCGIKASAVAQAINKLNLNGDLSPFLKMWRINPDRWMNEERIGDALWDVDHVVPIVAGGGCCQLDGLQTLCLWCHIKKTKAETIRLFKENIQAVKRSKRVATRVSR